MCKEITYHHILLLPSSLDVFWKTLWTCRMKCIRWIRICMYFNVNFNPFEAHVSAWLILLVHLTTHPSHARWETRVVSIATYMWMNASSYLNYISSRGRKMLACNWSSLKSVLALVLLNICSHETMKNFTCYLSKR